MLSFVWVRIIGVLIEPEIRTLEIVELVSQAIGKLVEIDERSLGGSGPICIRVRCPNPAQLSVALPSFYFGVSGMTLTIELDEDLPTTRSLPHPQTHRPPLIGR
jgi:hypothetical protein